MAHGMCEGIWIKRLFEELEVKTEGPMKLFCDNQSTICIAKNPMHHDRTKHVKMYHHFIKEKLEENVIKLVYTHKFSGCRYHGNASKLGMNNIFTPT